MPVLSLSRHRVIPCYPAATASTVSVVSQVLSMRQGEVVVIMVVDGRVRVAIHRRYCNRF